MRARKKNRVVSVKRKGRAIKGRTPLRKRRTIRIRNSMKKRGNKRSTSVIRRTNQVVDADSFNKAYDEGFDAAYNEGFNVGYPEGLEAGQQEANKGA